MKDGPDNNSSFYDFKLKFFFFFFLIFTFNVVKACILVYQNRIG